MRRFVRAAAAGADSKDIRVAGIKAETTPTMDACKKRRRDGGTDEAAAVENDSVSIDTLSNYFAHRGLIKKKHPAKSSRKLAIKSSTLKQSIWHLMKEIKQRAS